MSDAEEEIDEEEETYQRELLIQREAVIGQIRAAFADSEYPGDDKLFGYVNEYDWTTFAETIMGKRWQDLEEEFVCHNRMELYLFEADGFRYYLPAWLITSLEVTRDWGIDEIVLHILTPPPYSIHVDEWFSDRAEPLTLDQKRAVLAYFEHLNEGYDEPDDPFVQTLNHYWRRFKE